LTDWLWWLDAERRIRLKFTITDLLFDLFLQVLHVTAIVPIVKTKLAIGCLFFSKSNSLEPFIFRNEIRIDFKDSINVVIVVIELDRLDALCEV